jgi:hypothetical protein
MPNTRLPDCRPPRRDDSITLASSHPELLIGEIVMRPRFHIPLSQAENDMLSTWRRGVLAVCALLAAAITGYFVLTPGTRTIAQGVSKDEQARAETCVQRQMHGQVANQDTMPACAARDEPANSRRGASIQQPQSN